MKHCSSVRFYPDKQDILQPPILNCTAAHARFEILECCIGETWAFTIIFIIQHSEKVKAVPTPIEIDLLEKIKRNACSRPLYGH